MSFQLVRLDSLLRDIITRVRANNNGLEIKLDIQLTETRCQADPTRLAQVLENLISNAIKYAPDSPVEIRLAKANDMIHIAVSDHGPGIAPEHLEHLFKRFYRVPENSSNTRGTGLGLFICRQIIHAHRGDIAVESTVGEGTTFHIYIPCGDTQPVEISEKEKSA
jgi:signal transduction histidine kinase